MANQNNLVVINGGSSSIKFAMYQTNNIVTPIFSGSLENIGTKKSTFNFINTKTKEEENIQVEIKDYENAAHYLLDWLELQIEFDSVKAVGHRLVHGMQHTGAVIISVELLTELKEICPYDPDHLPGEIKLIEIFIKRHPALIQVACFDTAFHTTMPNIAKLLPIPRKYFAIGIQRYGFHGLSYAYLMQELKNIAGNEIANGKIILAHLGNGASLAAVKQGKCIDTSMGFTPAGGLVMGTRSGDLDPGLAWYLMQVEKMTPQQFNQLINHESGLLGISGTSADMEEIIKNKSEDLLAAEAFELFCYQTKKFMGAYAAALEGLDALVFSGGIGENSPEVRSQICDGLEFLGIELCEIKNMKNEILISTKTSKVAVYVIKTNEELMIAKLVVDVLMAKMEIK